MSKENLSFEEFGKVDLRIGTIIDVAEFPKARNPSYRLRIDFGNLGILNSSAQITELYTKESLLNKQIIAVINFEPKQIANFISQCLVLGIQEGKEVVLLNPSNAVNNGSVVS